MSLIPTPPYPSYPGNYACGSGALARVFERFFGRDDIPFTMTWATPEGGTIRRSYNGFRQLADESARSRIYGGIHFQFDTTSSQGVCIPLGDYVFTNVMRPTSPFSPNHLLRRHSGGTQRPGGVVNVQKNAAVKPLLRGHPAVTLSLFSMERGSMERGQVYAALGLVAVTLLLPGCGDAQAPVQPTPVTPTQAQGFGLQGGVRDTAYRPLGGTRVEVIDGPRAGTFVTTDDAGRFSMPGTFTGSITVVASKDSYLQDTKNRWGSSLTSAARRSRSI